MTDADLALIRLIRADVGVAKGEPTEQQLALIKRDLKAILDLGREPTLAELRTIVLKYCKSGPLVLLESLDNSDLKTLLLLALKATPTLKR